MNNFLEVTIFGIEHKTFRCNVHIKGLINYLIDNSINFKVFNTKEDANCPICEIEYIKENCIELN